MYRSTLTLTSALDGGGLLTRRPDRFTPGKETGTYCTRDWVGSTAGLDGCGKSCPQRGSIRGQSSPYRSRYTD